MQILASTIREAAKRAAGLSGCLVGGQGPLYLGRPTVDHPDPNFSLSPKAFKSPFDKFGRQVL
jgi:hypothetical protein